MKVSGNRARDERTNAALNEAGWTVLRFWEHEDPRVAARAIGEVVRGV
jgi:DNA mismatch endonuclease (patch repair protein)